MSIDVAPLLHLSFDEQVFAYSRISPNGRLIAYTREVESNSRTPDRRVRVIDVANGSVLFEEPGMDAYWSTDGSRVIYLSLDDPFNPDVSILDVRTRRLWRNVAPVELGDYFSWGTRDHRDVIATIKGNYFYLDQHSALLPSRRIISCDQLGGTGERPLLSKDGSRVTTFVRGLIAVRNVDSCDGIVETGIQGAKADFSFDGKKIAFHRPKPGNTGFGITIVNLDDMTRADLELPGSSYYPSWTANGYLSFRYESEQWSGFVVASQLDKLPKSKIPPFHVDATALESNPTWEEMFGSDGSPEPPLWRIVVIWAPWNAHSLEAIRAAERAKAALQAQGECVEVYESAAPSPPTERQRLRMSSTLPQVSVHRSRWVDTWADAQIPVVLVFEGDVLLKRLLGAQSASDLRGLIGARRMTRRYASLTPQVFRGRAPLISGGCTR